MSIHSFNGVTRIRAQSSAQSGIFLDLSHAGGLTTIGIELEPELSPVRDLLVSAINNAARAADMLRLSPSRALPLARLDALQGDGPDEAA